MGRADTLLFHARERRKSNLNLIPRRAAVDLQEIEWAPVLGAAVINEERFSLDAQAGSALTLKLATEPTLAQLILQGNQYVFDGFIRLNSLIGTPPWELILRYNDSESPADDTQTLLVDLPTGGFEFELPFLARSSINGTLAIQNNEPTKSGILTVNKLRVRALYPP